MTKILNSIEKLSEVNKEEGIHHLLNPVDLLTRVKLFLKITRVVVEYANKELLDSKGQQMQFFTMIRVFTEKIQSKLYALSFSLIKGLTKNTKRNSNEENPKIEVNKEEQHCN